MKQTGSEEKAEMTLVPVTFVICDQTSDSWRNAIPILSNFNNNGFAKVLVCLGCEQAAEHLFYYLLSFYT